MGSFHPRLAEQIRSHLGADCPSAPEWVAFFAAVDAAYRELDHEASTPVWALAERASGGRGCAGGHCLLTETLPHLYLMLEPDGTIVSWRAGTSGHNRPLLEPRVGQRLQELVGEDARATLAQAFVDIARGSPLETIACTPVDATGEPRSFELIVCPAPTGHRLAIVRAIDASRVSEAELRRAREAVADALRIKSELAANLNHEIRTPLNAILGLAELLLDSELDPEQRSFLVDLKAAAENLLDLIIDMLDFDRLESAHVELDSIPFSVRGCMRTTVDALASRAHQKGLGMGLEIARDVPDRVVGDPGRLRQTLLHLLRNAIKFTARGRVGVSVEVEREGEAQVVLRLCVQDTGIGIQLDQQRRIFAAFTQADGSSTRRYGGAGIGLAICSHLVELMGGTLDVHSTPGAGSTFTFDISLRLQTEPAQSSPEPAVAIHGLHILVLEPGASVRSRTTDALEGWGARVRLATSESDALATLREAAVGGAAYHLVLIDDRRAGRDGLSLATRIRQASGPDTAILLLTSVGRPGDAARARALGLSGYLTDPVDGADLRAAVIAVLGADSGSSNALVTRHSLREARARMRLLVAEEAPGRRAWLTRVLERRGHHVRAVATLAQMQEALATAPIDLLVLGRLRESLGIGNSSGGLPPSPSADCGTPTVRLNNRGSFGEAGSSRPLDPFESVDPLADIDDLMAAIDQVAAQRSLGSEADQNPMANAAMRSGTEDGGAGDPALLELQFENVLRSLALMRSAIEVGDSTAVRTIALQSSHDLAIVGELAVARVAMRLEQLTDGEDKRSHLVAIDQIERVLIALQPLGLWEEPAA